MRTALNPTTKPNPFATRVPPPSPQPQTPVPVAAEDYRAEATTIAANLLGTAGVSDFRIFSPSEAADMQAHAAWKAGSAVGSLNVYKNETLENISSVIIGRDARSCKKKFASGSMPNETGFSARVFSSCGDGSDQTLVLYNLVPRKAGGHYVFATMSAGDAAGQPARDVDTNIRSVVFKVLPR